MASRTLVLRVSFKWWFWLLVPLLVLDTYGPRWFSTEWLVHKATRFHRV